MKKEANDNDLLTFNQIGLAAALVINRIRNEQTLRELMQVDEKKKEDAGRDSDFGKTDEQRTEDERRYIEQRLREIRAWEKRQKGI
jgi:hypothetical protein